MKKIKYLKSTDKGDNSKIDFRQILKGVIGATVFVIMFLLLAAALLTYTDVQMSLVNVISSVVFYIGALFSGVIASMKLKSSGWLHGIISGGIFVCVILLINIIFSVPDTKFSFPFLKIVLSVALGGIGGIVGVNIRFSKNNRR